jgi:hypothetical protein
MFWACVIEDDVPNHYEKPFSLSGESTRKRSLSCYVNETFTHPLPELLLSRPELIVVGADDPRRFFLLSLCRFLFHLR